MLATTQLFGLGMSIKNIHALCNHDHVHLFWKDTTGCLLGCNDRQEELILAITGCKDVIGKSSYDFLSPLASQPIIYNDKEAMNSANVKFIIETAGVRECLSVKSQLKNSANNIVGTIGLAFYFDEVAVSQMINVINQLNFVPHPSNSIIPFAVTKTNNNSLTKREKDCASYLLRGMSAKEIGRILNISTRTVECHIAHIKTKLNCYSRSQIISKILDNTLQ